MHRIAELRRNKRSPFARTADENNQKSRNAILRLGAQQEGIVRHERIMPDGRKRNSVRFSIIDYEWPQVRLHLEQKLAACA